MEPSFVHLRVHSEYSLIDGLLRIKPLVKAAAGAGMPAIAVTDQVNLFALVRFYRAAVGAGVKPIAGVDLWLRNTGDANQPYRLTLLVQNRAGYLNLTRLVSRAYLEGQQGTAPPQVERDWVAAAAEGLIALSGGPAGDVGQALLTGNQTLAEQRLDHWLAAFGDRYYLELLRTGRPNEAECLERGVDLATARGVPVVATNDVRFLTPKDFEAHEARVCIHEGRTLNDPRRQRQYSPYQYLRSAAEMAELFADLPEALENSVEIARRCNVGIELGKAYLPDYPVPAGMDIATFLGRAAHDGLGGHRGGDPAGESDADDQGGDLPQHDPDEARRHALDAHLPELLEAEEGQDDPAREGDQPDDGQRVQAVPLEGSREGRPILRPAVAQQAEEADEGGSEEIDQGRELALPVGGPPEDPGDDAVPVGHALAGFRDHGCDCARPWARTLPSSSSLPACRKRDITRLTPEGQGAHDQGQGRGGPRVSRQPRRAFSGARRGGPDPRNR